jgi:hypothetical protein
VPLSSFWTLESMVEIFNGTLAGWTLTRMCCWIAPMYVFPDWEPSPEKFCDELVPDFVEGVDCSDTALPVYVQDGYIGKVVSLLCLL